MNTSSADRPHGATKRSDGVDTASSYRVAQSGHGWVPSSTHNQARTIGTRSRSASHRGVKVPWKTIASASALPQR